MRKLNIYFSFLLIIFAWISANSQCITDLNFHQWSPTGNPNVQWIIESDTTVRETAISTNPPAFFVMKQNFLNVKITGTMRIEHSYDDDFVGFVFGYKRPGNNKTYCSATSIMNLQWILRQMPKQDAREMKLNYWLLIRIVPASPPISFPKTILLQKKS